MEKRKVNRMADNTRPPIAVKAIAECLPLVIGDPAIKDVDDQVLRAAGLCDGTARRDPEREEIVCVGGIDEVELAHGSVIPVWPLIQG